jgi:uncharacterized SAM-binding protein YcdF (DUF218 family)
MFILLKILLFFFRPLIWILAVFLIALFTRKPRRKILLFRAGLILLLFFTNPFFIRLLVQSYEPAPAVLKNGETFQAGIVLGGFVSYNSRDDRGYFNSSADRFIQTALLYRTGRIRKVIVAAGNGYITKNNFREAWFTRDRLVELGIPAADIYTDAESRNTLENAVYSKKIIDSFHIPGPYLLISSAMHLPRASMVFEHAGIRSTIYPCDFVSRRAGNNWLEDYLLPSAPALGHWDNFIKEILGVITYKITGKG